MYVIYEERRWNNTLLTIYVMPMEFMKSCAMNHIIYCVVHTSCHVLFNVNNIVSLKYNYMTQWRWKNMWYFKYSSSLLGRAGDEKVDLCSPSLLDIAFNCCFIGLATVFLEIGRCFDEGSRKVKANNFLEVTGQFKRGYRDSGALRRLACEHSLAQRLSQRAGNSNASMEMNCLNQGAY